MGKSLPRAAGTGREKRIRKEGREEREGGRRKATNQFDLPFGEPIARRRQS